MSLLSSPISHQVKSILNKNKIQVSYYGYLYLLITQTLMINLIKQWGIFHNQHSLCITGLPLGCCKVYFHHLELSHLIKLGFLTGFLNGFDVVGSFWFLFLSTPMKKCYVVVTFWCDPLFINWYSQILDRILMLKVMCPILRCLLIFTF